MDGWLPGGVVLCKACGYENQAGHRFCGMCGTPLPHPPMTTPGAQSTLDFARGRREGPVQSEHRSPAPIREHANASTGRAAVLEIPHTAESVSQPASVISQPSPASEDTPPAHDMVPEIPLEEYVRQFHYTPPTEPAEITMRGDVPVGGPDASGSSVAPAESRVQLSAPEEMLAPASADVDQRLGLEPAGPAEEQVARSRFLDIEEPLPEQPETQPPALDRKS